MFTTKVETVYHAPPSFRALTASHAYRRGDDLDLDWSDTELPPKPSKAERLVDTRLSRRPARLDHNSLPKI